MEMKEKWHEIEKVEIETWKNSIVIKGKNVNKEVLDKIKEIFSDHTLRTVSCQSGKDNVNFNIEIFKRD